MSPFSWRSTRDLLLDTGYGMVGFKGIRGKGEDWNVSKNEGQEIWN